MIETSMKTTLEYYFMSTCILDPESDLSQTVTDIVSNVQLIAYCYKVLKEKLISLWENWKAQG